MNFLLKQIIKDSFNIHNDVIIAIALVWLVETLGNIIHACDIFGDCIFDTNYKKVITLKIESLDMICAYTDATNIFEKVQLVFCADQFIPQRPGIKS